MCGGSGGGGVALRKARGQNQAQVKNAIRVELDVGGLLLSREQIDHSLKPQFGHNKAPQYESQHEASISVSSTQSWHTVTVQIQHTVTAQSQHSHSHSTVTAQSQHEASISVMSPMRLCPVVAALVEARKTTRDGGTKHT